MNSRTKVYGTSDKLKFVAGGNGIIHGCAGNVLIIVPPAKAEEMYHPETFGRGKTDASELNRVQAPPGLGASSSLEPRASRPHRFVMVNYQLVDRAADGCGRDARGPSRELDWLR